MVLTTVAIDEGECQNYTFSEWYMYIYIKLNSMKIRTKFSVNVPLG